MRVFRLGHGLAIRIPTAVVEALQLKEGDEVEIQAVSDRNLEVSREPTVSERLKSLRRLLVQLPEDFRFDRDEANER